MQYAVIIAVLAVIALAVWLLRRRKVETIETRVYRLSDAFKTPSGVTITADATLTPIELDYMRYGFVRAYVAMTAGQITFSNLQLITKVEASDDTKISY